MPKLAKIAAADPVSTKAQVIKAQAPKAHGGILLGWQDVEGANRSVGFASPGESPPDIGAWDPILYEGDEHLLTVAPTGSGKGRSVIIPNLLRWQGPAIVIDPKGEAFFTTARRRAELGQEVHLLDPFNHCRDSLGSGTPVVSGSLNPFDLFKRAGSQLDGDAEMLANLLTGGRRNLRDPFWDDWGISLMSGVIAAVATLPKEADRNFGHVRKLMMSDDIQHNLAHLLDTHPKLPRISRENISSVLAITDVTRSGIMSTAQSYLRVLNSESAQASVDSSTIWLDRIAAGKPMTIYLVLPPDKLESHGALMRLWVGAMLLVTMGRKRRPAKPTLFILDEAAQLGEFAPLRSAMTLMRGYGVQVWPFFQDLSQLRRLYPDWETIRNNASVFQSFGIANHTMAREVSETVGDISPDALRTLERGRQVIAMRGQKTFTCRSLDYLDDPVFKGLYDPNPLFQPPLPDDMYLSEPRKPRKRKATKKGSSPELPLNSPPPNSP